MQECSIGHSAFTGHNMKIITYAILKDYFDKEFILEQPVQTIDELQHFLTARNPAAKDILAACRYAVKDRFVTDDFVLAPDESVHIIPPSSGG